MENNASNSSKKTKHEINHNDVHEFFSNTKPPNNIEPMRAKIEEFIKRGIEKKRKAVLITSGGTTIPLEKNTVRFIDNFSTGGRGAAICEHFLEINDDYDVIYLHRTGSIMPFARHLPSRYVDLNLLDMLSSVSDSTSNSSSSETIVMNIENKNQMKSLVNKIHSYKQRRSRLLLVPFTSLSEYLSMLRMCCETGIKPYERNGMVILSAAVSDFYIPEKEMAEHKIQSREGPLQLELAQVPKCLGMIRDSWAPNSFVVSFKLETDLSILRSKALGAIEKYGVHAVVANELHTRYEKVILYQASAMEEEKIISRKSSGEELDGDLVSALAESHNSYISQTS